MSCVAVAGAVLAAAEDWPLRLFAVLVILAVILTMQVAAIQKQAAQQAEQRFWFKVGDEMAQHRFEAYKRQRRLASWTVIAAAVVFVLLVVLR